MSLVELSPEKLVKKVVESGAKTLAFTYNEPIIWHEYILDVTKLLQKENIKSILVTNGYSTPQASKELIEGGIDTANIDIKAMHDDLYQEICGVSSMQLVLDTAKRFKENGIHVEITNLIIPTLNDTEEELSELCEWVIENLGENTPLHFSAYHPDFQSPVNQRTPYKTLDVAYNIAKKAGLYYPYVGNIRHEKGGNTYCPNCGHLLLERRGYMFEKINVGENKLCPNCQYNLDNDIIGEINPKPAHQFSLF